MRPIVLLTIFGGGVAQTTFAPALRIGDVVPDIAFVVVLLLALRRGSEFGCLAGFAAGLVQDAVGGGLIGVQALTKAMAGFLIGAVGGRLTVTHPVVQVTGLVCLSMAEGLGRYALLSVVHFPAPFVDIMLYVVVPQALYNGFLGAASVLALAWTESLRERIS